MCNPMRQVILYILLFQTNSFRTWANGKNIFQMKVCEFYAQSVWVAHSIDHRDYKLNSISSWTNSILSTLIFMALVCEEIYMQIVS